VADPHAATHAQSQQQFKRFRLLAASHPANERGGPATAHDMVFGWAGSVPSLSTKHDWSCVVIIVLTDTGLQVGMEGLLFETAPGERTNE
jgi:hypothetical protein